MALKKLKDVKENEEDEREWCMQWSLFLINILVFAIGLVLLILGSWTVSSRSYIQDLQVQNGALYNALMIIMIVAGVILILVAILGFVAAFIEKK